MWAEGGRECVFVTGSERESERMRERERERDTDPTPAPVSFPALTRWHPLQLTESTCDQVLVPLDFRLKLLTEHDVLK